MTSLKLSVVTLLLVSAGASCGTSPSRDTLQVAPPVGVAEEAPAPSTHTTESVEAEPVAAPIPPASGEVDAPSDSQPAPVAPDGPPEDEAKAQTDASAQCASAQDKLIEIGRKVNGSIAEQMESQRKAWVKKCEERVGSGDTDFHDNLRCVAESEDFDTFISCDGWTDWPSM